MPNDERNLETMPDGALGLIPLESCKELGLKVDQYLVGWREKRQHQHQNDPAFKVSIIFRKINHVTLHL